MSLPGLAVLYASIVPKKWAVNVLAMMFAGFSLVLIVLGAVVLQDWASAPPQSVAAFTNGLQTQLTGVGWVEALLRELRRQVPGSIMNSGR
jgi:ammonia channel protein AmtB